MIEHNIVLNVKQPGALETGIELTQGDYGQVAFYIRVKDDNAYITNATKATMIFNLSDGTIVNGSATISAGTYSYVFKGNELQTPGKVSALLTLGFSDGRLSSCGYTFEVRYNPLYDKRIPAGIYISELENIVQQAQGQIDYLNQIIQILQGDIGGTVLTRANLVNNFLATIAGVSALDAVAGKTTWDKAVEAYNIASAAKATADKTNSDLAAVEPKHIVRMGAFVGNITRNASMVSGKQVTLSLTILSPEAGIAGDTPIFYVNGALNGMIGFVIIGNFNTGYVFSSVNEVGDTVFHIRTSAGVNAVPGGAEIFILAVGEFV